MASQIDVTKPIVIWPTTASIRQNFAYAKSEIEAVQTVAADAMAAATEALLPVALDSLSDVTAPSPAVGDALVWDGTAWVNSPPAANGGGGAAKTYYLTDDETFADNNVLASSPSGTAEVTDAVVCNAGVNGGVTFIGRYVSAPLGGTSIEGGQWTFNTFGSVSANAGLSEIITRINLRKPKTGITVTFTGSGTTRTLTASGGTPFLPEHATSSILTAALAETATQTAWISTYTSSTVVTVTLTNPAFVNTSNVSLDAIYTLLFSVTTGDIAGTAATLYQPITVQPAYSIDSADRIVAAYFGRTDSGSNKTITLYHNGTEHYTNIATPMITRHNDLAGLNEGNYLHQTPAEIAATSAAISAAAAAAATATAAAIPQWQIKTAAFNAVANGAYMVNTTSASITATLPATPATNDVVRSADYAGTFAINNLTVARNGKKIMGLAEDLTISTNNVSLVLTYIDATQGWRIT